jgi:predicted Rossmann fold flavoprotein
LLPDLRADALDEALRQQSASAGKRLAVSLVPEAIPRRLAETLLARAEIAPERRAAELGRGERQCLVEAIKSLAIPLEGARGFEKAEVTAGGVSLDEVDSSTMQSKLVPNLYWAGEVLDLDGPIGGYNFQAAFSTGWLAGISV